VQITVLSLPENVNCIEVTLNNGQRLALTRSPKDVSEFCIPGRNELLIHNGLSVMLTVVLQIELKLGMNIQTLVQRIPRDMDSALDFSILSISSDSDVETLKVKSCNTCPITLKEIQVAVKGTRCKHVQPFDASSFLLFCSQTGSWKCPICG
jgi:hypothetical protein